MADDERVIPLRIMRGVDLNSNARLTDQGTYTETLNLWAKSRGVLELRPGSSLVASQISAYIITGIGAYNGGDQNYKNIPMHGALAAGFLTQGTAGVSPFTVGAFTPAKFGSVGRGTPMIALVGKNIDGTTVGDGKWVNCLKRAIIPFNGQAFLFGAMDSAQGDFLFYVSGANIIPIPTGGSDQQIINSQNGNWQMDVFQFQQQADSAGGGGGNNWNIIAVNGLDAPLKITTVLSDLTTNPTQPFGVSTLQAQLVVNGTLCYLTGPTCFAKYGNQAVWGAPKFSSADGAKRIRLDNYICFSNPVNPNTATNAGNDISSLAIDTDGSLLTLQIGNDLSEPVTAVAGSPAITEAAGFVGQLCVFTPNRVVVYTGPLPSSGNPLPAGFGLTGEDDSGTVSPKTVIQTKYGTIYLGTDGLVRLIALDNRSKIIGRALEPLLGAQTPHFYSGACAYYSKGFYHLFFPFVTQGNNHPHAHNTLEYVCDLRSLNLGDPRDCGVEWFGPWIGRRVSCVTVSRTLSDASLIHAGLGHRPAILRLEDPSTYSDPDMQNLGTKVIYPWRIVTGDLDIGDLHQDKKITAFSIGIACRNTVNITGTISALGDGLGSLGPLGALGFSKTLSVPPNSPVLGGNFMLGSSGLTDGRNPSLPTWQPSSPIVGRAFIMTFEGNPTVEAALRISDFEFRAISKVRRPTMY